MVLTLLELPWVRGIAKIQEEDWKIGMKVQDEITEHEELRLLNRHDTAANQKKPLYQQTGQVAIFSDVAGF